MTARDVWIPTLWAVTDRHYSIQALLLCKALLPYHVLAIFFVLADAFDELGVRVQLEGKIHRPGFRVRLWIIERHLDIEVAEVAAVKTFGDAKGVGVGMSVIIEPAPIIESVGFGDERVAFPVADAISEPGLRCFGRKTAAVGKDLAKVIELLIEEHNNVRGLEDLVRKISNQHTIRNAVRYAALQWFAFA